MGERVSFNGGYLFLQKTFHELGLNKICNSISKKYEFQYDLSSVLANLIYARILSPSSKLSSFEYMQELIETPEFELHDVYRALDVLEKGTVIEVEKKVDDWLHLTDGTFIYYEGGKNARKA